MNFIDLHTHSHQYFSGFLNVQCKCKLSINIESEQNIPTLYDHLFDIDWDQVAISDDTSLYQSWNGIFHRDRNIKMA